MKGERRGEEGREDVYGEKIRKRIRAKGDVKRRMREVENKKIRSRAEQGREQEIEQIENKRRE